MKLEEFVEACSKQGLVLNETQVQQYCRYAEILKEWNEKMNLTAIVEFEEVLDKHFYDSLLPSFTTHIEGHLCDVGSGAGFPSIPLKIAYPELKITILEPLKKRVTFLETVKKELNLSGVTCLDERAEDYAVKHRETFDVVTARAVANLNMLAELCIPLVKKEGLFLAMKGSNGMEEYNGALSATTKLGCELVKEETRTLQDGSSRINLFYRKVKSTPSGYPRMFAKIKKNPL
ncbi:16S rRNA (guanine(527)-N(7))-methyltransferase RsmG [Anaerorhabdus sp.]|uniref:16S rRNA (guanine(527)-N(7))-methyltransferase RsmG n=1 Tax=Anaerorhabdus sp. TaxID=1872524 RepID=UPI002FC82EBC